MLMNELGTRTAIVVAGIDIGVVTVHEDICGNPAQSFREQIDGPECAIGTCPGSVWAAVEAVNQDDVDLRVRV